MAASTRHAVKKPSVDQQAATSGQESHSVMARASTERVSRLHTQSILQDSFCSNCVHANQDISDTCKICPIFGHLIEIGDWLTTDMQKTKPAALCEKGKKAQIDTFSFSQAEYDELKVKGLQNAEIAHLLGVTLNVFNRYKTKHGIRVQVKEGN